jgi:threonyl-tRNA synthetase
MQNTAFKDLPEADKLYRIRHSLAHLLAMAVLELRPGSRLGFGPPIDDGFYYDFILSAPLTESDFPTLENTIRRLIKKGLPFSQKELLIPDALTQLETMQEPYKKEYAQELVTKNNLNSLSFYYTDHFVDMCEGPHVENSRQIPSDCFALRSVAGAYWRGDSQNVMMTRLYAWAFLNHDLLKEAKTRFEEAAKRDHKKLGKQLEIFHLDDDVGPGLPLWLPNGTIIRDELEKFITELEFQAGYQRVTTPHLAKTKLFEQTGHLPYYAADMFPLMTPLTPDGSGKKEDTYCLRPMNCPHHHKVFASRPRSYRELPLRLAEYGQVYRYEDSGALSGLLRVRGLCQNDGHIYCTKDQVKSELISLLKLYEKVFAQFHITDFRRRLSTWDPDDPKKKEKFGGGSQDWEWSQHALLEALNACEMAYFDGKGEAAFYGPKIDFQLKTVIGREETLSTIQVDFLMAERLGLCYTGSDNQDHRPIIIHRAPLSTHERFVAFLIEHYAGAFPTWLAPIQAQILPLSDKYVPYAHQIAERLRTLWIRTQVDDANESIGKKIRSAIGKKVPNMLILGEKEQTDQTITLRRFASETQVTMSLDELFSQLQTWIRLRKDPPV